MTLLHRLLSVARWILGRRQAEEALDEELQSFVDMAAREKMRDGMSAPEARRLALIELGGLEQTKERVRTGRHGAWLDEIGRDVKYAFRMCAKSPGFTAIVVLTLALGIGANTAIFSLLDALMLRWLPVSNPHELVQVEYTSPDDRPGSMNASVSYAMVRAFADQRDIFRGVAGFSGFPFQGGVPGAEAPVRGALVTGDYYDTLGLRPVAGRLLSRADDEIGAPLAAVISDAYWERHFARSGDAVGRQIRVNGAPATIVGVTPPGFVGSNVGSVADVTLTVSTLPVLSPGYASLLGAGNFWLRVVARPAPGLSTRQAEARLNTAWAHLADSVIATHWPASRRRSMADSRFHLSPGGTGWTYLREIYRKPLVVLMAVVALVLLIACANVASLMLARASVRQREMTLRLAIGAGRGRIVRQLLIESILLSVMGAVCGTVLASAAGEGLVRLISSQPGEIVFDLTPNLHTLGFTTAVAVATGVLFGIAPAMRATALDLSTALKDDARTGSFRSRLLPALVSMQVALSVVVLGGAGLFVRTLQNLQTQHPGFNPDGVLLMNIDERRTAVPREYLDEVRQLPGVVSASFATHTPLSGSRWSEPAVPAGQTVPERDTALFVGASPGFFETMQIPLVAGRDFTDRDAAGNAAVAIVNAVYAKRHFGDRSPIGEHLSATVRRHPVDLEVVGVAGNTSGNGLRNPPPATVYVAYAQLTEDFPTTIVVRATGPFDRLAASIQQTLQPKLARARLEPITLSEQVGGTMVQERMMAMLATAFGLLALALVSVGLYGLLAYGVAQRTKEIGIRMALGAQSTRVVAMILLRGASLVMIGVALGLPAAWLASRWIESMLFGLTSTDPAVVTAAILLLATAAQLAALVPARRAARVDPMVALRHD